jgi:23S rRNA pseudoU1915 N3-methylase RlmH
MSAAIFNFGYAAPAHALCNWGARAIWRKGSDKPLDILPDRQMHDDFGDPEQYKLFVNIINQNNVLPRLQQLAAECDETGDYFCEIVPLQNDCYSLVLQGTCHNYGDYFYVGCALVYNPHLPASRKSKGSDAIAYQKIQEAEYEKERQRIAVLAKLSRKQEREKAKDAMRKVEEIKKIAQHKNAGETLEVGDHLRVWANQGDRDAIVLAIAGQEALIRYFMPNGREFLRRVNITTHGDLGSVPANKIPKKFGV